MAQAKAKTTKAVAKPKPKAVGPAIDFSADIGGGVEGTDKDSFAIPRLAVIQAKSPQVVRNDAAFIKEAAEGMLFNTVTQKLYPSETGVIFLPCAYQRRFIQWAPRKLGGGFKGEFLPEEIAERRSTGDIVDDGEGKLYLGKADKDKSDHFSDTRSHFGIMVDEDGTFTQVILSLAATQIKKSKQLMSMLAAVRVKTPDGMVAPPTWMNQVRLTTVFESNDQGSWFGVRFTGEGFVTDGGLYDAGKAFHAQIIAGGARTSYEEEHGPTESGKF